MSNSLIPIPNDRVWTQIGKMVHLKWARHGCCWILESVDQHNAFLITPKTRKKSVAKRSDLCYTRNNTPIDLLPDDQNALKRKPSEH